MNIQGWFPLGLTGLISLQSKGLSRVFSSTTVWKHQFFSTQPPFISKHKTTFTTEQPIQDDSFFFILKYVSLGSGCLVFQDSFPFLSVRFLDTKSSGNTVMMGGYMSKTSGRPHWLQTRCVLEWLNPWESVHFPSALQPLSTPFIFSQNLWKANCFLISSYLPNSPFSLQPPPHPQGSRGVSAWTRYIQCLLYCGQSSGYRTTLRHFFWL